MSLAEVLATAEAAGLSISVTGDGGLHIHPTPPAELLDLLRHFKSDILAALAAEDLARRRREWHEKVEAAFAVEARTDAADRCGAESGTLPCRSDPDFADVEPDPAAEIAALREGWTQRPDGRWEYPAAWARLRRLSSERT